MSYTVRISDDAESDLYELSLFVAQNNSLERAEQLVDQIMERCAALSTDPTRGHIPPELSMLSIKSHLQVHFKPYRVIYRIDGRTVWIDCILDGRRDLEELLQRRVTR